MVAWPDGASSDGGERAFVVGHGHIRAKTEAGGNVGINATVVEGSVTSAINFLGFFCFVRGTVQVRWLTGQGVSMAGNLRLRN